MSDIFSITDLHQLLLIIYSDKSTDDERLDAAYQYDRVAKHLKDKEEQEEVQIINKNEIL